MPSPKSTSGWLEAKPGIPSVLGAGPAVLHSCLCRAVAVGQYPHVTPFSFHKSAAQSGRYATTPNSDLCVHQGEALVLVLHSWAWWPGADPCLEAAEATAGPWRFVARRDEGTLWSPAHLTGHIEWFPNYNSQVLFTLRNWAIASSGSPWEHNNNLLT